MSAENLEARMRHANALICEYVNSGKGLSLDDCGAISDALRDGMAALLAAEEMQKRMADCIVWMDTREKMTPGLPRLCDEAKKALAAYRKATGASDE